MADSSMITPDYILRFMAAVFSDAPDLALASFNEKHAIVTATETIVELRTQRDDIVRAYNWPDRELAAPSFWASDRLHLNSRGHHRVAARVLTSLGLEPRAEWWSYDALPETPRLPRGQYLREHLGPWVKRRLTGTSSGDGREPKYPALVTVEPTAG